MSDEDEVYEEHTTKKGTKIKIGIDPERVAKELNRLKEDKDAQTEYDALMVFDSVKEELVEATGDKNIYGMETPQKLKDYLKKTLPKYRVPSGKATLRKDMNSGEEFESPTELLDSLYEKGYPRGMQPKTEEAIEARKKIKKLFDAMLSGKAWGEMQDLIKNNKGEHVEQFLGATSFFSCPKCNHTISRFPCGFCGYDPKTERREGKVF